MAKFTSLFSLPFLFCLLIQISAFSNVSAQTASESEAAAAGDNETKIKTETVTEKPGGSEIPEDLREMFTDEVTSFLPPAYLQNNFVYYLSGFDEAKRPVWILEVGKWDLRGQVEGGDDVFETYDKFLHQTIFRMINSTQMKSTKDAPVSQAVILLDFENLDLTQISSVPTVSYVLKTFKKFTPAFSKLHAAYCINTNFMAESVINLVRPIMGKEFEKVEVFGSNKDKWAPKLLKKIPKDQLPEWYGGIADFKPVQVYG